MVIITYSKKLKQKAPEKKEKSGFYFAERKKNSNPNHLL